jgi:inner membrane protein
MLGAALCVFYLLELSLSERIGFTYAYGVACLAILGMVAAYTRVIFKRQRNAKAMSAGVRRRGHRFVRISFCFADNEDAALLAGSIGLFVILAGIMFVTRGVDWYSRDTGMAAQTDLRQRS